MYTVLNMERLGRSIMSRIHRSLCTAGAFLALSGYARADTLGDYVPQPSIPAFSFNLGDQAEIRGIAPQLGATGLADLSATEDDEDGAYDRFQDQIGTLLAAGQAVEPAARSLQVGDSADRFRWNDRGGVWPSEGAQSDVIDLSRARRRTDAPDAAPPALSNRRVQCLHQDLYGAVVGQRDGVIFAVCERPVQGTRGRCSAALRRVVSGIKSGERFTLGIVFHDAG